MRTCPLVFSCVVIGLRAALVRSPPAAALAGRFFPRAISHGRYPPRTQLFRARGSWTRINILRLQISGIGVDDGFASDHFFEKSYRRPHCAEFHSSAAGNLGDDLQL